MNITLCARSKVLQLSTDGAFRIKVHGTLLAGNHVDLIPNAEELTDDIKICTLPLMIADIATVNFLAGQTVDFDSNTDEFIISRRGLE